LSFVGTLLPSPDSSKRKSYKINHHEHHSRNTKTSSHKANKLTMGLFSSTKIPQPPLPNIIIDLSTPSDKVFRPHDVVSGNIIFVPTVPIIPRAIEVSLFGQSLVWYRTDTTTSSNSRDYHHWRDNAPLFEVTTNVVPAFDLKAPTFAPGETYTYPFQFQLPAGTGNSRVGQYKNNGDTRWTVRPHLLPPR
jgi:hypothetical protein